MGALRFLDSLQFLNASLETLVSNLTKDGLDKLVYTKRPFRPGADSFCLEERNLPILLV